MNIFELIPWAGRFRLRRTKLISIGKLRCVKCEGGIRRGDHYEIIAARHINCKDPKLAGRKTPKLELPPGLEPQTRESYRLPSVNGAESERLSFVGTSQEPVLRAEKDRGEL